MKFCFTSENIIAERCISLAVLNCPRPNTLYNISVGDRYQEDYFKNKYYATRLSKVYRPNDIKLVGFWRPKK